MRVWCSTFSPKCLSFVAILAIEVSRIAISSPSTKVYRIKPSQIDTRISGRELPVDFRAQQIAFERPGTYLLGE